LELSTDRLRTILNLEHKKDYADLAVIGGLDRYLHKWARQIRDVINDPKLLTRFGELNLTDSRYATWNRARREEWIKDVLDWLSEFERCRQGAATNIAKLSVSPAVSTSSAVSGINSSNISKDLNSPVTIVKGVSANLAAKLGKLGVKTVHDLIYFFPRRHLDYSQRKSIAELEEDKEQTILAMVWQARVATFGYRRGTEVIVGDETGNIKVVWLNQPYLAKKFRTNAQVVISGKVSVFKGQKVFQSPEWELAEDKELIHTGRLVPVYPLTQGLYPRRVRRLLKRVIDDWAGRVTDFLPEEVKGRCQLLELAQAIIQAHYPDSLAMKDKARERLAFDELFLLQLGVLTKKRNWQEQQGNSLNGNQEVVDRFVSSLPFRLTQAQQQALQEILSDLKQPKPMSRLLEGEVGSGKTIVAIVALLVTVANGYQAALMAPTEILAEQHFNNICQLLSQISNQKQEEGTFHCYHGVIPKPLTIALLVGNLAEKEKEILRHRIERGEVDIVIGTHALIQRGVEFNQLSLAVIDEQHRFGVLQRSALCQKGFNPHVLVMTATPIPRTLALTLYGDLDLSVIDELPPGRQMIKTKWLKPEQREAAYAFVRRQIAAGRQAFVVCPLIEESENIEAKAATVEYERLSREVFPDLRLGLLHGRMSADNKEKIMWLFHAGEFDILVSTPVVEVGIDVANAAVILVEGADRFGLSQLHQFRGRVGRGSEQSYCLLLAEEPSAEGEKRLALMEQIHDGFALAEKDLELRGPGEFFGIRQSGLPDLHMANLSDVTLLELARREAIQLFQSDPHFQMHEHRQLAQELTRVWCTMGEWS